MTKTYNTPQDLLNKRILIAMGNSVAIDVTVDKVSPEGRFIYVFNNKDCGPQSGNWIQTPASTDCEIIETTK
jgi:hypothetical protein